MPDTSRRYTRHYRAALVSCWIGGAILATAAGLVAAQWWFPPQALYWAWGTVSVVLAVTGSTFCDRAAAAWARAALTRFHRDCS
jgi:hypothetical protein